MPGGIAKGFPFGQSDVPMEGRSGIEHLQQMATTAPIEEPDDPIKVKNDRTCAKSAHPFLLGAITPSFGSESAILQYLTMAAACRSSRVCIIDVKMVMLRDDA